MTNIYMKSGLVLETDEASSLVRATVLTRPILKCVTRVILSNGRYMIDKPTLIRCCEIEAVRG